MSITLLEMGPTKPAVDYPHFPTTFQAVVWRNWGMVPLERLAAVLSTTTEEVIAIGAGMGLEPDDSLCQQWLTRGYQTIIRQNWHLLTYEQIMMALDWTEEKLAFIIREDDFLWHKLGALKPTVEPPKARPLTADELAATAELATLHREVLKRLPPAKERPFDFLRTIQAKGAPANGGSELRMLYAYSALYGDPLMDEALDPFPDNQLAAYAASGVNAVWMQAVLYTLVPWLDDPGEDGSKTYAVGCETRLAALKRLTERMSVHGIKLMLYLNEPRSMPVAFFEKHPDWRGEKDAVSNSYALCTSAPGVLEHLRAGVERLFREVPKLGGLFCITMSENLTNCWSRTPTPKCPRCSKRKTSEIIVEVLEALSEGAHAANPEAKIIAWNWAWGRETGREVVDHFPKHVLLQCVSETALPTNVGGCPGAVQDYSISKIGPGPIASDLWSYAREHGVDVCAKVQLNCTWELSAVPYIPVPGLVSQHLKNLRECGIRNFMLSWTLGGYPGGNLRLLDKSVEELTVEDYGEDASSLILQAYEAFDEAFKEFPLNGTPTLYYAPQNFGPMDILFDKPTGYRATMIGFPYDALDSWRGTYPRDVFEEQFRLISEGFARGCALLRMAQEHVPEDKQALFADLMSVAETAFCHFRSTYMQICFVRLRDAGDVSQLPSVVREEQMLAKRMLMLMRADSRLGFEASNHYYYTQNALIEKLFNCRRLLKLWAKEQK